jgi:hypothetical protein
MDFIRILEMFFAIGIISLAIKFLNNKGISIGSYKKNYPLKLFLVLVLMGILIRINFLFVEFEYLFKDTVETIVGIIIIYIIMALLNRNGYLDKPNINDFVGALLIVGGIVTLIAIMLI